jgi:hypothetical protein
MFQSGTCPEHEHRAPRFHRWSCHDTTGAPNGSYAPGASRVVGAGARLADGMNDGAEFFDFHACEWRGHDFAALVVCTLLFGEE